MTALHLNEFESLSQPTILEPALGTLPTVDLSHEVTADALWDPTYDYDQERYNLKYRKIGDLLVANGANPDVVREDLELSLKFINESFDRFYGLDSASQREDLSFAFIVPTRINSKDSSFAEEINPFMPLLRHVDPLSRVRTFQGMVPTILDRYMPNNDGQYGAIIFAPAMQQMVEDLGLGKGIKAARKAVEDAAFLAHERLGAPLVGLGATLPKFTKMGATIRKSGLEVTTGHAATVAVFSEMPEQLKDAGLLEGNRIGLLGQGSIGLSTGDMLLAKHPDYKIVIFDTNSGQLKKSYEHYVAKYGASRIEIANDVEGLIEGSDVILSAITSTLTDEQAESVKVPFADDSQPTSISEKKTSELGITYVQPMVQDMSESTALHKQAGFNYGGYGAADSIAEEFTCGGEVAALSISGRTDLATHGLVTPEHAVDVKHMMEDVGIVPARLQGFGRYIARIQLIR